MGDRRVSFAVPDEMLERLDRHVAALDRKIHRGTLINAALLFYFDHVEGADEPEYDIAKRDELLELLTRESRAGGSSSVAAIKLLLPLVDDDLDAAARTAGPPAGEDADEPVSEFDALEDELAKQRDKKRG